jgi:hypothetical protein
MADFFAVEVLPFQFRNEAFDGETVNATGCPTRPLFFRTKIYKSSTKSFL